jgi:type IV fimbrial biogenesis protein FimT
MHQRNHNYGFNILELMIAITVLGVLLGIGIPSFNEITRSNRTAAQSNELMTALSLARSEATKLGMPVSVCAASDATQSTCAGAGVGNWQFGWVVFSDRAGAQGVINGPNDVVLQTFRPVRPGLAVTTENFEYVGFRANGSRRYPGAGVDFDFRLQPTGCTGTQRREIDVSSSGRAQLQKVACL